MRTKVERTCKKTGQQKVNISLSSPKVVLNANDCARFLDNMGKTANSLVEKEAKMVADFSGVSLPVLFSPTSVTSTTPSQLSPSASTNVSSTLWAAAQTQICKNWNSSSSSAPAESSDTSQSERSHTDSSQVDHQSTSVLPQMILKPPKKRRGGDKKFETTPSSLVFNNGDIVHPVIVTSEESLDAGSVHRTAGSVHRAAGSVQQAVGSVQQATGSPPLLVPSHRGTFQKHSVEQLLQHQPGPSVNASNIHTLITRSYAHDSRLHLSFNDSSSLSPNSPSVMSSSSPTLEDYKGRTSFAPQLYPKHFPTKSQPSNDLSYHDHTSSVEIPPSLTLSHVVPANRTRTQSGNFLELPEQIEPMNLSTSCKPAVGLLSLQMSSTTDIHTAEDISKIHVQLPLENDFTESCNLPPFSETLKQVEDAGTNNSAKEMSETANSVSFPNDPCSELHPTTPPVQNGLCDSNCEAAVCVSKTPAPPVDVDLSPHTISQTSLKTPHKDTEPSALHCGVESQVPELSSEHHGEQSSNIEPETQSQLPISPETLVPKTLQDAVQTACKDEPLGNVKKSSNLVDTEIAKKPKKTPKKKVEIPMDEAACADRMQKYSLTIEDIIANFVYTPEPLEEFSLTEEEEASIRDQFEKVSDSASSENSNIHAIHCATTNAGITGKASLHNGYNMVSIESETLNTIRPLKKRPTSVIEENSTESHQHKQKRVENIDNVLAFVANDCTDSDLANHITLNTTVKAKKQKKQKTPAGDESITETGKLKNVKNNVCNKVPAQNNNGSIGESNCPCAEIADKTNVSGTCGDIEAEDSGKSCKTKKAKKRRPGTKASELELIPTPAEGVEGIDAAKVGTQLKRKAADGKVKTPKKKKINSKQAALPVAESVTSHTELALDKEGVGVPQVETSDIGESIASTSGSSEQDTPVHEQESKDGIADAHPQMTDRENHDTGLESGGEDKQPVRRYKKRLDFVKCEQCDHQARGRSALSRHLKKVHMLDAKMPFKCQHCDYGCTKMASLNRHLFTHGVYSCSRCIFVTDERTKLTEHTVELHKDKVDVKMCKVCNRYIKCDLVTIEQHTQECHGPTPFQCAECEKEFKYASSLRVHYHTHYPDQPKRFKCEQCDYRTNYKANLHKHHKNMHASRDRDIQCPDCGKLFSTEDNMRRHRKVHTMVRPFACDVCEKTFKTSGALKGHQLVHTLTRPYLCNIPGCNRNFRTPKFLKSHQEEFHRLVPKKFFCSVEGCNYSFFKRSHLKRHAITHTGERNFHCTWPGCIKSFRHADNLKVHFRSHTNEKPVQCHLCDFKCRQKNSLFWHKKRVHQVIDVSVCPRRIVHKIKPIDGHDEVQEKITAVLDMGEAEDIQTVSPALENASETLVLDKPPDVTNIVEEELLAKSKQEDSSIVGTNQESSGQLQSPTIPEPITKASTTISSVDQAPVDLYEFKSDDESEEETPGSFRRDKNAMNILTPLPPPPKELLRKNEIQEMKEREKKEKAEKKEQEKMEKAERKQQEKNEKVEKKNLEKKAREERKELELKEKSKLKEQEKKDKVEKKEIEKKNKLEQKKIERKEKIEKRQQEKREKIEKKEQEKKEKAERKELDKKLKPDKKLAVTTNEGEDSENCEAVKSPARNLPNSLKRKKSPVSASKEEPAAADTKMCKKGRKKLQEINTDTPKSKKPSHKMKHSNRIGASLRRRMVNIRKREEAGESSSSSSSLTFIRAISKRVKSATLKRTLGVRRCKQKDKLSPPKRKPSARIKAKNKTPPVKTRATKADSPISNSVAKEQKSPKPAMKRKYVRKKATPPPKEVEEVVLENVDTIDANINTDPIKDISNSEGSQALVEEVVVPLIPCQEEPPLPPVRPASPASSEEIMVQGKASPYRDFSDDENLDEETKTPDSCLSQNQASCTDVQERCEKEEGLSPSPSEKNYNSPIDKQESQPAEDYSDDDDDEEVSNDIPLTPPRAPAPPPVESSEDELESEPEPTPFSVPGPNTPFSVPGPNTPFSIPPPTNLMQQHSVNSEETLVSAVPSVPSMEMQGSVDMQQSLESVEIHPRGSVEMNHSHGSVEMHHPQGSFEVPHSHSSMEIRSHNPVEVSSHGSVEMAQSHGSVEMMCHRSITESMSHSEQQVHTPESLMRDISNNPMSEKYELPQSLQEQTQASEADKEYFDQYLKSLSAANNRAANGGLEPSPSGLQQLEAMVGKSHIDSKEISRKSPHSCLPTSVITSLEGTLPLLSHGDLRARIDAFVSDRHHESLFTRDTPSSLSRISDRQTPLPHSAMGHSPAFDAFSSLNSLHPAAAGCGRENSYLRQPDNLFPTPPGTNSFMTEAMFQRQAMTTPFLAPQPSDRSSLSRMSDASSLQSSSSSSLLRRSGTVPGSDMFSPPTMTQSIPRHPFANAWTSQEARPAHWQTPYLSHQPNMAATGTFFPSKDNYLTGREFMFDPSIRPSTDRSMFPSLASSQSQDSFQLDRFDLCNYFPNAMTPYGSSPSSLEYSRSAHVAASKPFDDRYRQATTTSSTIPDFRGLPPSGSSDMFSGLPGVNSGFNLYAGNPMSYHSQHMADNVNSAFLTHSTSAQHALFERDYAAAAHRSLYPQNTAYPFVDERQYPGSSKLAHAHSGASAVAQQERELVSRSAAPESQMQDPYRSLLYRY